MALKYHPDKSRHVDASQHFCEIYASYNWLICNYASDTETSCSNSQKQDTGFKKEKGKRDFFLMVISDGLNQNNIFLSPFSNP